MTTYYDKDSKECTKEDAVAYQTEKYQYIYEYDGHILKKEDVVLSKNKFKSKFVRVGPIAFKSYLKYLSTNLSRFYLTTTRNPKD